MRQLFTEVVRSSHVLHVDKPNSNMRRRLLECANQLQFPVDKQPDVNYVRFILNTEGMNENNITFVRSEILRAFRTPVFKPIDVEHVVKEEGSIANIPPVDVRSLSGSGALGKLKNTIIGVIIDAGIVPKSRAFDTDPDLLTPEEIAKLPTDDNLDRPDGEKLAIVCNGILYSFMFPATVEDVLRKIAEGRMFVSMESWYPRYDYAVGSKIFPKKGNENLENFFETRRKLKGQVVSRVLRDHIYGACAVTKLPANEESIFLEVASHMGANLTDQKPIEIESGGQNMGQTNANEGSPEGGNMHEEKIKELEAKIAELTKQWDEAQKAGDETKMAELKKQIEDLQKMAETYQKQTAALKKENDMLESKANELEKKHQELEAALAAAKKSLEEVQAALVAEKTARASAEERANAVERDRVVDLRLAALQSIGLSFEDASAKEAILDELKAKANDIKTDEGWEKFLKRELARYKALGGRLAKIVAAIEKKNPNWAASKVFAEALKQAKKGYAYEGKPKAKANGSEEIEVETALETEEVEVEETETPETETEDGEIPPPDLDDEDVDAAVASVQNREETPRKDYTKLYSQV